jgi:hypothetical protein
MIWSVRNTLYEPGPDAGPSGCESGGDAYDVDAVTGKVLGKLNWASTP